MAALLIFDADCAFCQRALEFGRDRLTVFPEAIGFQFADFSDLPITREQATTALYLQADGRAHRGHRAVAWILSAQPGRPARLVGRALTVAPVSWLAAGVYALVARYRHRLPGGTAACRIDHRPANPAGDHPPHPATVG